MSTISLLRSGTNIWDLTLAPLTGDMLVALMTGAPAAVPLAPFAVERF